MKRSYLALFLCLLSVLLWGCGQKPTIIPSVPLPEETEAVSEMTLPEISAPELPPELAAFGQVFDGILPICHSTSMVPIMLSNISQFFTTEEFPWHVVQVAVLDLDSDGVLETVLEVENYVGFVILEYQNDTVLGTEIWYRAFRDPKADGSFSGSGSSFNRNYWQYASGGNLLLAERYETADGVSFYSIHGEEADADAFAAFEEAQNQKENLQWYPDWETYLQTLLPE